MEYLMVNSTRSVETALDAAALILQNGGSTLAAERGFSNVLHGHGSTGITTVWRLDLITAIGDRGGQNTVILRAVGPIGVNLVRVAKLEEISELRLSGDVVSDETAVQIADVRNLVSPYPAWLAVLAAGAGGAFFSQVCGGDRTSLLIAFVAAGIGQSVRVVMQSKKIAIAAITLICGLISSLIAAFVFRSGISSTEMPTLVASVIYLVPGLPLINGFMDLISYKFLFVGVQRIANASFLFLTLAIAIAIATAVIG